MAQEATKLDHLHEVEHMGERVVRLEKAITEAAWSYRLRPGIGPALRKLTLPSECAPHLCMG
jgi:hypothetical protein